MTSTEHFESEHLHFQARKLQRHPVFLFAKDSLRFARQLAPNVWRLATCRQRRLPSAVIVGAQKAGTTQLFAHLIRHPRCFSGVRKELHYFSKRAGWPLAWYQSRFPLARQLEKVGGICLEASPSYLPSAEALRRMHEVLPDAVIIVALRDPVARAFSHYQHDKTRRRENRSFSEVVSSAIARRRGVLSSEWGNSRRHRSEPLLDCVARGYYALQLEALFACYPREQVLIVDSGDLFADINAVCQQIFSCLGLEPIAIRSDKIYNRGYYRETIGEPTAQRLREHYLPHDELLARLLGRNFSWMRAGAVAA